MEQHNPGRLLEIAFAFAASKTLLSAVELGLFTELAREPMEASAITRKLSLHPRGVADFLDSLVALQVLERDSTGRYHNTPVAATYLDRNRPEYIGGMMEMANSRLYPFWGNLTQGLRTGQPQNEVSDDPDLFKKLYSDPDRLAQFLRAMTGLSVLSGKAIAERFDFRPYKSAIDIGPAEGAVIGQVALAHPHLTGGGADLPQVRPVFEQYMQKLGIADRMKFQPLDFFNDPFPTSEVLIMGHILHDWGMDTKRMLLQKAYKALPPGGALIVFDAMIDDQRRRNIGGLLMSLNMLIETPDGFDYTGAQCQGWMKEAGFKQVRVEPLTGADSMAVGIK